MYKKIPEKATTIPNRARTQERTRRTPVATKTKCRRTAGGLLTVCTNIGHKRHLVSSKNKLWMRCVSAFSKRLTRKSRSKVGKRRLPVVDFVSHSVVNIVTHLTVFQQVVSLLKKSKLFHLREMQCRVLSLALGDSNWRAFVTARVRSRTREQITWLICAIFSTRSNTEIPKG